MKISPLFLTLVLGVLLLTGCGGGGGTSSSTTGGNNNGGNTPCTYPYDGTYSATITTVTPAGTTVGTGTFTVASGSVSDAGGTFTGTVDSSGAFSGTTIVCDSCAAMSMSGTFSTSAEFTLSGSSGSVSQTITAQQASSNCSGGNNPPPSGNPPTITTLPPSARPGEPIEIIGENFPEDCADDTVTICDLSATVQSCTTTSITVVVPTPDAPAACDIVVTTPGGTVTATDTIEVLAPTTLSQGCTDGAAYSVAVDANNLYWSEYCGGSGSVKKMSLSTGTVDTLASGLGYPWDIAIDANSVYWVEDPNDGTTGSLKKADIASAAVETLVPGLGLSRSLAVDGTHVYWTEFTTGLVKKLAKSDRTITTLASGLNVPLAMTVDATNAYWSDSDPDVSTAAGMVAGRCCNIRSVGLNGGAVTPITSDVQGTVGTMINDATNVYWTEGGIGGHVQKMGKAPPYTVMTLATNLPGPVGIAVDNANVYWTEYNGGGTTSGLVKKISKDGGTETTLASGLGYPRDIVVDATHAYWAESLGGRIRKAPIE